MDLSNRIEGTCRLAPENLKRAATRCKKQFDRKAKIRIFEPGVEVLLLLPKRKNKMQLEWQGPFKVLERIRNWDYKICVRGKKRLYHANLLKRYQRRTVTVLPTATF